jgi:hypothetical protein
MALSKAKIFNLALSALLLQRRTVDPDTDQSNEVKVLLTHYDVALESTLEDCDLDSTAVEGILALVEADPNDQWDYAYAYPSDCLFFRRIQPDDRTVVDDRSTHQPKLVRIHNGQKVIFTDKEEAIGEWISSSVPISSFSANLGLALAYKLAMLSAPLIVGKGAKSLTDSIERKYITAKAEAQEKDRRESFSYVDEIFESEFVRARTT